MAGAQKSMLTPHMTPASAPAAEVRRVASLDILRGFAILRMIVIHVQDRASSEGFGRVMARWLNAYLANKGYATFAILFGASFAIMLRRAKSGRSVAPAFLRRLLGIAAFGILAEGV